MDLNEISLSLSELNQQISSLENSYEHIYQQTLHNETVFWTVALGVFTAIGLALYFIAKSIVQSGVEKGISSIKADHEKKHDRLEMLLENQQSVLNELSNVAIQETGVWTPEFYNKYYSLSNQSGKYLKIGDLVIVWFDLLISEINEDDYYPNTLVIQGLPFISNSEEWCDIMVYIDNGEKYHPSIYLVKGHIKPMQNVIVAHKEDEDFKTLRPYYNNKFKPGTRVAGTMMYRI